MRLAALHQRNCTAGDLARLLAAWLVVVLLLQGMAALRTLVSGPAHRHLPVAAAWAGEPAASSQTDAHQLVHEQGLAHYHGSERVVVPADGEAALDAATFLLLMALLPLAMNFAWRPVRVRTAMWPTLGWALIEGRYSPPRRPPRG
jgi:hypothetical protein